MGGYFRKAMGPGGPESTPWHSGLHWSTCLVRNNHRCMITAALHNVGGHDGWCWAAPLSSRHGEGPLHISVLSEVNLIIIITIDIVSQVCIAKLPPSMYILTTVMLYVSMTIQVVALQPKMRGRRLERHHSRSCCLSLGSIQRATPRACV